MATQTQAIAKADTNVLSIVAAAFIGISILFVAGFANSATIHDATHDVRHASGFPCH